MIAVSTAGWFGKNFPLKATDTLVGDAREHGAGGALLVNFVLVNLPVEVWFAYAGAACARHSR